MRSRKYDVAVNKETPVMLSDWVDTVWERGKLDNIHATDKQFARFVVCIKPLWTEDSITN